MNICPSKEKNRGVDYDEDTNIFYAQFLEALNKINGVSLSPEESLKIINELKIKLDNDDLGKAFFSLLKDGINGLRLVDFSDITNNSYVVVTVLMRMAMTISGLILPS